MEGTKENEAHYIFISDRTRQVISVIVLNDPPRGGTTTPSPAAVQITHNATYSSIFHSPHHTGDQTRAVKRPSTYSQSRRAHAPKLGQVPGQVPRGKGSRGRAGDVLPVGSADARNAKRHSPSSHSTGNPRSSQPILCRTHQERESSSSSGSDKPRAKMFNRPSVRLEGNRSTLRHYITW